MSTCGTARAPRCGRSWRSSPRWPRCCRRCAPSVNLPAKLAWTIAAIGAGYLVFWWVLFILPSISLNVAFLVTLGVGLRRCRGVDESGQPVPRTPTRRRERGTPPTGGRLWVAIAATVLALGSAARGQCRRHVRVAWPCPHRSRPARRRPRAWLCSAPSARADDHDAARHLRHRRRSSCSVFTAALVIRFVTPTGAVLLSIAIGGLLWQRRAFARLELERRRAADQRTRVGGRAERAVGLDDDGVGVAGGAVERSGRGDVVTTRRADPRASRATRRPRRPPSAAPPTSTCRTRSRGPRSAHRGAATAVASGWSAWNRRATSWARICGWASPPIVPSTAATAPSRRTRAGHSVCGGRRPGANSAGWPSASENPRPRFCRLIDVVGSTRHEPKPGRVGLDQADRPAVRVSGAQVRGVAVRRAGSTAAPPTRTRRASRHVRSRRRRARRRRRPRAVARGGRRPRRSSPRPADGPTTRRPDWRAGRRRRPAAWSPRVEVALGVRRQRAQLDAEHVDGEHVDPLRLVSVRGRPRRTARRRGARGPRRRLRRRRRRGRRGRSPAASGPRRTADDRARPHRLVDEFVQFALAGVVEERDDESEQWSRTGTRRPRGGSPGRGRRRDRARRSARAASPSRRRNPGSSRCARRHGTASP